ncbi:DNA polymerase-3 subunit epsilon [Jejuia pallidilutea]|uniref:DNA polymerase-3 subunit epsilon n=1 Tax=Jejuia pallidilutea TaxID=504487 RepID=A0A362X1Z1_9FLAO|nr:3'-5' exonuclease [Jejuia pallidilutea]PQV50426.1 DNA polymerase-3 subunit epsilon [Jejuia pallidilutea]
MRWLKKKTYPEFWTSYLEHFKTKTKDFNTLRFIAFDTETTGLNTETDRILSIGAIAIKGHVIKVSDSYECYIKQDVFNAKVVKINGLLKEGRLDKIDESTSIIQFLEYIKDSILVAHHAAFDVAMINAALKRMNLPKLKNKVIDTGRIYKKTKYVKNDKHYSLDELCDMFNIRMHDRHTASGDAYLTALLFLKLSSLLRKKNKGLKLSHFLDWI